MKISAWITGIVAGLIILALAAVELMIGFGVESESRRTMATFPGGRIEALIAEVDFQTCGLGTRTA